MDEDQFVAVIREEADRAASSYLHDVKIKGRNSRQLKAVTEGIVAADYRGRTVIELLQNAHDAHPAGGTNGQVLARLAADEGTCGVLYVANGGTPLAEENFFSLCDIALSTKRPNEGIGNKGVGFKSVLNLSDSPQIYSASGPEDDGFRGFSFRFARPEDFDDLAARTGPGDPDLAGLLRANVSGLKVPVPLHGEQVSPTTLELRAQGYCTVVRLPLRNPSAREAAREQLLEVAQESAPFNLFLERVKRISVQVTGSLTGSDLDVTLTREPEASDAGEVIRLHTGARFLMLRRRVPEAAMTAAINESRVNNAISVGWEDWEGDAEVAVALPLEAEITIGRLYTFLPMGVQAVGPIAAYVNAPFFASLDRRSMKADVPVNSLLLDEVAELCAETVLEKIAEENACVGQVLVDLMCWNDEHAARLDNAFKARDTTVTDVRFVPDLRGRTGRLSLARAILWQTEHRLLCPRRTSKTDRRTLVATDLGEARTQRLLRFAASCRVLVAPTPDELAGLAESCARRLYHREGTARQWRRFFDELSEAFPDPSLLAGRKIIPTEAGLVHANGGAEAHPTVFTPPTGSTTETLRAGVELLGDHLCFLSSQIRWRKGSRKGHPGRNWLVQELVREYNSAAVLRVIGTYMADAARTDEQRWLALGYAFALWSTTRSELGDETVRAAQLRVPTHDGWRRASMAIFGRGWQGPEEWIDNTLSDFATAVSETSTEVAQVASMLVSGNVATHLSHDGHGTHEPHESPNGGSHAQVRTFLQAAGVRHGLPLFVVRMPSGFSLTGQMIENPTPNMWLPEHGLTPEQAASWKSLASKWPAIGDTYTSRSYRLDRLSKIPGQDEFSTFDDSARRYYGRLIVHGLAHWPETAIAAKFQRPHDYHHPEWPSLAAVFLTSQPWFLQTTPGDRLQLLFTRPDRSWWVDGDTPDYLAAQPAQVGRLRSDELLSRLQRLGVRVWEHPASARARVEHLTRLTREVGRPLPGVRRALEAAWDILLRAEPDATLPDMLVSCGDSYEQVEVTDEGNPVFVNDRVDNAREQLVRQSTLPVVALRDRAVAARFLRRCNESGWTRFRSLSDVSAEVRVAGVAPDQLDAKALSAYAGEWVGLVTLGVMEHVNSRLPRINARQLADAVIRLASVRIVVTDRYELTIEGHTLEFSVPGDSFLTDDESGTPLIIVVADASDPVIRVIEHSHTALADLVRTPQIDQELRLALVDLGRIAGPRTPNLEQIATVLHIDAQQMTELQRSEFGIGTDLATLIRAAAWIDPEIAAAMKDASDHLNDEASVIAWLREYLPRSGVSAELLVKASATPDPIDGINLLGISLSHANAGMRSLGMTPIQNGRAHERQLARFIESNREMLGNDLRDRFAASVSQGIGLELYIGLRDFETLQPDPDWLDTVWELDDALLLSHVLAWLDSVEPDGPPASHSHPEASLAKLPPVADLRSRARTTFSSVAGRSRSVIHAWISKHSGVEPPPKIDPSQAIVAFLATGVMDFKRIDTTDVVGWLAEVGYWPEQMPLTTNLTELGLTDEDLASARTDLTKAVDNQRKSGERIDFDGQNFSNEDDDVRNLAKAVWGSKPPGQDPEPFLVATVAPAVPAAGGGSGGGGSRSRQPRVSPEKTTLIGLAGEAYVADWIERTFNVGRESSWRSESRNRVLQDDRGRDSHGYDFRVVQDDRILLFEVKSTTGDAGEFSFGESEFRRARDLAADEDYYIAFVTHVLEPGRRRLQILPNPVGANGMASYHIVGRAIRLQFEVTG